MAGSSAASHDPPPPHQVAPGALSSAFALGGRGWESALCPSSGHWGGWGRAGGELGKGWKGGRGGGGKQTQRPVAPLQGACGLRSPGGGGAAGKQQVLGAPAGLRVLLVSWGAGRGGAGGGSQPSSSKPGTSPEWAAAAVARDLSAVIKRSCLEAHPLPTGTRGCEGHGGTRPAAPCAAHPSSDPAPLLG